MNEKIGLLILQLRKEKELTQQQLAEQLNISNKTVSKWECGLGCPDVSLWNELATILGADILKLLQGELKPNKPDVGKIDKARFYVCPTCGNILVSTGEAYISCCGRNLTYLTPTVDSKEYEASIEKMDIEYYVSFEHEMTKEHYISFVAHVHYDRILLIRLYPEQSPEAHLPMTCRGGNLYTYCTRHGLQRQKFKG